MPTSTYQCDACGSPLMESPSGSICPNGHGRIHKALPLAVKNFNHRVISTGARAVNKQKKRIERRLVFQVPGGEQLYQKAEQTVSEILRMKKVDRPPVVFGIYKEKVIAMVSVNEPTAKAGGGE